MRAEADMSLRRWRWIAGLSLASSGLLLAALVAAVAFLLRPARPARQSNDRLIGAWQSDADRTIAELREHQTVDDRRETALRKIFGKLRITWTATTYTTDRDGFTETNRYEVLGRDKLSAVIRDIEAKPSPLKASEFTVIHFDGRDAYWVNVKGGRHPRILQTDQVRQESTRIVCPHFRDNGHGRDNRASSATFPGFSGPCIQGQNVYNR